jgi:prepilin-type processing-associated H-X9-DG protein
MGKTALYLFVDGHVERLQGDRSEAYYSANPGETNIWKWW